MPREHSRGSAQHRHAEQSRKNSSVVRKRRTIAQTGAALQPVAAATIAECRIIGLIPPPMPLENELLVGCDWLMILGGFDDPFWVFCCTHHLVDDPCFGC